MTALLRALATEASCGPLTAAFTVPPSGNSATTNASTCPASTGRTSPARIPHAGTLSGTPGTDTGTTATTKASLGASSPRASRPSTVAWRTTSTGRR